MTDELRSLLSRCLVGEQAALGELVTRYRERVVAFCFRWLGQRQDAEDAAQETLIRVCRHLHHWDGRREFEPFLEWRIVLLNGFPLQRKML